MPPVAPVTSTVRPVMGPVICAIAGSLRVGDSPLLVPHHPRCRPPARTPGVRPERRWHTVESDIASRIEADLALRSKDTLALPTARHQRRRRLHVRPRHDDLRSGGRRGDVRTDPRRLSSRPAATFIDTADVYSKGASEAIIGRWLAAAHPSSEPVVLATKGRFPMGDGSQRPRARPAHLRRALDASLRRLGVEHIDLYQMHAWDARDADRGDAALPRRRVTRGQDRLLRVLELPRLAGHQGGARGTRARLGATGDAAAAVQPAGARHRARGRAGLSRRRYRPASVVAARRRLADRQVRARPPPTGATRLGEDPRARHGGVGAAERARSARGASSTPSPRSPRRAASPPHRSRSPGSWRRPAVTSVILGARTVDQLADNLGAASVELTDEERTRLDAVSRPLVSAISLRRRRRGAA